MRGISAKKKKNYYIIVEFTGMINNNANGGDWLPPLISRFSSERVLPRSVELQSQIINNMRYYDKNPNRFQDKIFLNENRNLDFHFV